MPDAVHLTFDQDWAPAWATEAIFDRLEACGLRGTLFVTQDGPTLARARATQVVELGWHPNFLPGSSHGGGTEAVLDTLQGWVPEAVGARAHCLIRGTPYLTAYAARGLRYDAADLHDGEADLAPFLSWTGVWRVPIWFEDDVRLQRGQPLTVASLGLDRPGLKVATFHPVLHALNCADLAAYDALKVGLREAGVGLTDATPDDFAPYAHPRGTGTPGLADLFEALTETMQRTPGLAGGPLAELLPAP